MTRPKKNRMVKIPPRFSGFKPVMVPIQGLESIKLSLDEYEALRLADFECLEQEEASKQMGISRPTFARLIQQARYKISDFIINGKFLEIEGGAFHFTSNRVRCRNCGMEYELSINKESFSVCPNCGSTDLINLAQQFGHGKCCRGFGAGRRGKRGKNV